MNQDNAMDGELEAAVSKLYTNYWHGNISGQEFQKNILALFAEQQQQLVERIRAELVSDKTDYSDEYNQTYSDGWNDALYEVHQLLNKYAGGAVCFQRIKEFKSVADNLKDPLPARIADLERRIETLEKWAKEQ